MVWFEDVVIWDFYIVKEFKAARETFLRAFVYFSYYDFTYEGFKYYYSKDYFEVGAAFGMMMRERRGEFKFR